MSVLASAIFAFAVLGNVPDYLPLDVRKDITYASEMCKALGKPFLFDSDFIETADMNEDGVVDYVIDTRGYDCYKMTQSLFGSSSGMPVYLYISTGNGRWKKEYGAYVYEYRIKKDYATLPYFDVWVRGDVGYKVNFQRYQWNGSSMEVYEQRLGVEVPKQLWKNFD